MNPKDLERGDRCWAALLLLDLRASRLQNSSVLLSTARLRVVCARRDFATVKISHGGF